MKGDEFIKKMAAVSPFDRLNPSVAAFFKDYLANEKITKFKEQYVLNTHFPPYPSAAFDNLAEHFNAIAGMSDRRLFSVSIGVTNRCMYNCWHCYNANRNQKDVSLDILKRAISELQALGAVMITLTGGEPLLRGDLEEITDTFDSSSCLSLNTTGFGLTEKRARSLRKAGLFAVGFSMDSTDEKDHDRLRGTVGAFRTALDGLQYAREAGLYPYLIAVATRELLDRKNFYSYMEFAKTSGALEVHLIEPSATGRLSGRDEVLLTSGEQEKIISYQTEVARREDLPALSSFTYLESPNAFGCGAGLTHLYIDGAGEVSPCNLIPLSFGNIAHDRIENILKRMSEFFKKPRLSCVGRILSKHIPGGNLPVKPELSENICREHLSENHAVPRFFFIRSQSLESIGKLELEAVYNEIHENYDLFWLSEAGKPVLELIEKLNLEGNEFVFEAGCGTGFATEAIAKRLTGGGRIEAVDLAAGMLEVAEERLGKLGTSNVSFINSDALSVLAKEKGIDVVFSSWVLGYIPLAPFFEAAVKAMNKSAKLAFIVHKDKSPREPLEIFTELIARDPTVLVKLVEFDFPKTVEQVNLLLENADLRTNQIWEGRITFKCGSAESALEHLLKSGAGAAYYEAVDPSRRDELTRQFVEALENRHGSSGHIEIYHEYISCVAKK